MSFLGILEVLNLIFSKFEQLSNPKFTKIQSLESLKFSKMTFLEHLNSPKLDFTQNLSGGKIINYQQSQALTSHYKNFWSIVLWDLFYDWSTVYFFLFFRVRAAIQKKEEKINELQSNYDRAITECNHLETLLQRQTKQTYLNTNNTSKPRPGRK